MVLYVVNTPIVSIDESVEEINVKVRKIDIEKAKEMLKKENFISAVGHESTAKFLSQLFQVNIPYNRIYVKYRPGDIAICIKLLQRLPESKVLSEEELRKIPFEIYLLEFY